MPASFVGFPVERFKFFFLSFFSSVFIHPGDNLAVRARQNSVVLGDLEKSNEDAKLAFSLNLVKKMFTTIKLPS